MMFVMIIKIWKFSFWSWPIFRGNPKNYETLGWLNTSLIDPGVFFTKDDWCDDLIWFVVLLYHWDQTEFCSDHIYILQPFYV